MMWEALSNATQLLKLVKADLEKFGNVFTKGELRATDQAYAWCMATYAGRVPSQRHVCCYPGGRGIFIFFLLQNILRSFYYYSPQNNF